MLPRSARVVAAVVAAVIAVLALSSAYRSAGITPSAACAAECARIEAPAPAVDSRPCVADPACGGGAHTPAPMSWLGDPVAVTTLVAAAVLLAIVRRRRDGAPFPGRLAAAGLYRPPRRSA